MFEVKVTVELPGIPEAINNLADAVRGGIAFPAISTSPAVVNIPAEKPEKKEKKEKAVDKPAITPVEPAPAEPPLAEVPTTEPEPSFIGNVPPDEPADPAPAPKKYSFNQISKAGAKLCADLGKMEQLVSLLNTKYGVPAITMIDESRYAELAADLISLGAVIEEDK